MSRKEEPGRLGDVVGFYTKSYSGGVIFPIIHFKSGVE